MSKVELKIDAQGDAQVVPFFVKVLDQEDRLVAFHPLDSHQDMVRRFETVLALDAFDLCWVVAQSRSETNGLMLHRSRRPKLMLDEDGEPVPFVEREAEAA